MEQTTPTLVEIPDRERIITNIVGPTAGEYKKLAASIGGKVIQINPTSENTQYFNPLEIPTEK